MCWMPYIPEVMILNQYDFRSKIIYNDNIHTRLLYTQAPKLTHTHIAYPAE